MEKLLFGIHSGLAAIIAPEFAMDQEEARALAQASHDLLQHYPVRWLDDKTLAWMNFTQTVGFIYGPRLMALRMRKSFEASPRNPPRQSAPPNRPAPAVPPAPAPATASPSPVMQGPGGTMMNGHPTEPPIPTREIPPEARVGEIPGVGNVTFPEDHPLFGARKPH